jgi:hypothetical protein
MAVNLEKATASMEQVLQRRDVPAKIKMAVKLCVDVSGSIQPLFRNGTVQNVIDRLIPVGMRFDDNQSIEAYAFSDSAKRLDDIKVSMFGTYVERQFMPQAQSVLWGGTNYTKPLSMVAKDSKTPLFGFGKKPPPGYLLFITDGDTGPNDERDAEEVLQDLAKKNVYVQLVGVGTQATFSFLKRMAKKYDTVGFVTFPSVERVTDDEMYNDLLSDELADFINGR